MKNHNQRLIVALIITAAWCMLGSVQAVTPYYHLNRSFSSVQFDLQGIPTEYQLSEESDKLTDIVQGAIQLNSNETYAIEKQMAIPLCYLTAQEAWEAAVAYTGTSSNYPGKIFDNVGWVRGIKKATPTTWGAYLWVLQNRIAFQSSTSEWWIATNGLPIAITNVMVGSLGDYGPMSNVVDIGPRLDAATNNNPGANLKGEEKEYQVDISNVFYQLSIPDIWIMPREAVTCVGGSNVQFMVTGTNIPQGVTWSLIPDLSGSDGAKIQTNGAWQTEIAPANVGTNYTVRATSKDNTNFYDQVSLDVVKVDIEQTETNVCGGMTNVALNLTADSYLGDGTAEWGSMPSGISGSGTNITFNPSALTPTTYVVKAQSSLLTNCFDTCTVTVIAVEFKEYAPCSGFDPTINPPWIMVPKGSNNLAKAETLPSAAASQIGFESDNTNIALVSPSTASSSPQTITITGVTNGSTEIMAKLAQTTNVCATLGVDVKKRIDKTIVIHAITEENDDVQVITVGQGQPNQTCITAGTNGVLDSSVGGDDVTNANTIVTGPNGICNTTASGDDVQVIAVGNGKQNAICVSKGANNFRDTPNPSGDDVVNGDDIDTGADGICDTTANNQNLVPNNVPSAAELQDYLNNTTWGKQANVYFVVTCSNATVNYDLNRDGGCADSPFTEIETIDTAAKDPTADFNVYYVKTMEVPNASTRIATGYSWIGDSHDNSTVNITAHETGHLLSIETDSSNIADLMLSYSSSANPTRVIKNDWDKVNP